MEEKREQEGSAIGKEIFAKLCEESGVFI